MSDDPHGVTATIAELACELDDARRRSERRRRLLILSAVLAFVAVVTLAGVTDVSSVDADEVIFFGSLIGFAGLVSRMTWGLGIQSGAFAFRRPVVTRPQDDALRDAVAKAHGEAVDGWLRRKALSNSELSAFVMSFGLPCAAAALFSPASATLSTAGWSLAGAFAAFSAISAFVGGRDLVTRYYEDTGDRILEIIFAWGETRDVRRIAEGRGPATAVPRAAQAYFASIDATLAGMRRGRRQRPEAAV